MDLVVEGRGRLWVALGRWEEGLPDRPTVTFSLRRFKDLPCTVWQDALRSLGLGKSFNCREVGFLWRARG